MAAPRKYTQAQMLTALEQAKGMVTVAARLLGCAVDTVYAYLERYPALAAAKAQQREGMTDVAELALYKAIQSGEAWAVRSLVAGKIVGPRRCHARPLGTRKDEFRMHPEYTAAGAAGRYYVYLLSRPDGTPFYVGKGTGRRILRHEIEARRGCECHKCRTIRIVWASGGQVQRRIIFASHVEREALDHEVAVIAAIGRANLTNGTDGGDGTTYVRTATTRAKNSAARRAYFASPEARMRHSEMMRARWASADARAFLSARAREAIADPTVAARRREARRRLWADPTYAARHSAALQAGRRKAGVTKVTD